MESAKLSQSKNSERTHLPCLEAILNLQDTDCDEVAENKRKGVSTEPDTGTEGLLRCTVPKRGD